MFIALLKQEAIKSLMCSADRLGMVKSTGPRFETPRRGIELNRLMVIEKTEMI